MLYLIKIQNIIGKTKTNPDVDPRKIRGLLRVLLSQKNQIQFNKTDSFEKFLFIK